MNKSYKEKTIKIIYISFCKQYLKDSKTYEIDLCNFILIKQMIDSDHVKPAKWISLIRNIMNKIEFNHAQIQDQY